MVQPLSRAATVDDLVALSDEIAALARAGVPLETGLKSLSRDLPGRLGRLAERLGERMLAGESLAVALQNDDSFPAAYRAVAAAGVRSGRLAAALEGIATTARRASEVRRLTMASMTYPMIVLAVACGVLIFTIRNTTPVMLGTFEGLGLEWPAFLQALLVVGNVLVWVMPTAWLLLLAGLIAWFLSARRAMAFSTGGSGPLATISQLVLEGQRATFAELLALLIEHRVPLVEALPLAAEATGNRAFHAAGESFARRLGRGEHPTDESRIIPPLLVWMLTTQANSPVLIEILRRSAVHHRERLAERAAWVGLYLPVIFSAGIGGLFTLFYVLLVMGPFFYLLRTLS